MRNVWMETWAWVKRCLLSSAALNAHQPLVAWEAAWDEAEALQASGQLWRVPESAAEVRQPCGHSQPES